MTRFARRITPDAVFAEPDPRRYDALAPKAPEGPIDIESLIQGDGPLEIDIGFGRGRSLFERAQKAPGSRIVGIEIKRKWAAKVDERCKRLRLGNVCVFSGDARELVARMQPAGTVQRAFVHFPDPWWKKKHTKRMVVAEPLLDALAKVFAPKAELFIQTDVADRAEQYLAELDRHQAFERATPTGYIEDNPFGARSNREVRAEEDGLPIYRILVHRVDIG